MSAYTYNTRDDPNRHSGKGAHNFKVFETHFPGKDMPLGLNMIDIQDGGNYRIGSDIKDSTPVAGKPNTFNTTFMIGTWYNTTLNNGGCTWLDMSKWNQVLQFGRKNAQVCAEGGGLVPLVEHQRAVSAVCGSARGRCDDARVQVTIGAPWNESFGPAFWTEVHECKVSWIAVPQDQPNVTAGSRDVFRDGEYRPEYKVEVEFDEPFSRAPRVLAALSKISMLSKGVLRLEVAVEDVTTKGMTLVVKNWGGCDLLRVNVDYIAVLD
ncbi:hypothetical protein RSOLAG22IIIB_11086 [Rhizoctonia solani]|uniref:H-type lectin domain-containing protein n=1 Tax=Rhizoctonia solani TaxID=456999 RepID=A0A0K6G6L6_9AGAM|nr:hypothetical protein RSOLAG22IIIB_11086 [Rhizoctonia solani]